MAEAKNKQNAKDWPSMYSCRFIEPGLVSYEDMDAGINLLRKEAIDKMVNSFIGKPVIIKHFEVTPGNFEDKAVGYITRLYYNSTDGWYWSDFLLINDTAKEAVAKGYSVSCAYRVIKFGEGGDYHAIRYNAEILEGEGEHLALVPNPRYEDCGIPQLVGEPMLLVNSKVAKYTNSGFPYGAEDKALVSIMKLETYTQGIIYRARGRYKDVEVNSDDHPDAVAAFNDAAKKLMELCPQLDKKSIIEEGAVVYNASGLNKESEEAKKQFAKEKKEHPEFSDEDIWKIVGDHMKKQNESETDKAKWLAETMKGKGKSREEIQRLLENVGLIKEKAEQILNELFTKKQNTKGAGAMATMKEKIVKILNDFGKAVNEAFEGKETTEEEAAEAKAKKAKEEEERKNALKVRANKCGLAENATEEEIVKKENEMKEEEIKKENARKAKEAADAAYFKALNSLRETGELQEGLTAPVPETSAERVSRGNARYGSAKK